MDLRKTQPVGNRAEQPCEAAQEAIQYPHLCIENQSELIEKLELGQTFQALITCKVTNLEAHLKDAPYQSNEGSTISLCVTDMEIIESQPIKPKGIIATFKEI